MRLVLIIALLSYAFTQSSETCEISDLFNTRSIYSIGDTLSVEDQNLIFPVCNGSEDYSTGDSFSLSDLALSVSSGSAILRSENEPRANCT